MPANDPTGRRFGEAAEAYERGRPSYPDAIVDWMLDDRPGRVLDLGAGTGKLTRSVVERAAEVVAVEPDAAMLATLARTLPGVETRLGTAEEIPLPDASVDSVVVGQAWHWMDARLAIPEVARVLRPGGRLALVWNDRDESDPWIAELSALLDEFGTSPDAGFEPSAAPPFGPFELNEIAWVNEVGVDVVVDMIASRSYVLSLPESARAELLSRVRAHTDSAVDAGGHVPVRYVTHGYRTHGSS